MGISALGRGTAQAGSAGLVTATLAMDDLVAEAGIAYRAVTCPSFFDNLLRQVQPIREKGMFFSRSILRASCRAALPGTLQKPRFAATR